MLEKDARKRGSWLSGCARCGELTRRQVRCGEDWFLPPSRAPSSWRHTPLADNPEIRTNWGDGVGRRLISFVNNEPFINKIKVNTQLKSWDQDRIRRFTENEIQRTDRHMKRFWTSLIIKEMLIKTRSCRWFPLAKI